MKQVAGVVFALSVMYLLSFTVIKPPQAFISNGLVTAKLYLPDANNGYYRGSRFDWGGVVASLEYDQHTFIEQWVDVYNPVTHDAILGPAEAFDPLDYDQTLAGKTFVKIGVGSLIKPDSLPYQFGKRFKIANYGKWTTTAQKDSVTFVHSLSDTSGYAYEYTKTVRLTKRKAELVLNHVLKNTGTKTIETKVYNHNFFVIDKQKTGPGITVDFPFTINSATLETNNFAKVSGGNISFINPIPNKKQVYGIITGFGAQPIDYNIKIESKNTGAGIAITCNRPLSNLVFWTCPTTSCPEPYLYLKILPQQEFRWTIAYNLYTFPPTAK